MKLIRNNVFETNSSSCHSITLSNDVCIFDTLYPNDDGNIILTGGQFGWEEEEYSDAFTKANYAAVDLFNNEEKRRMFIDVIKEHTGCNDVVFDFSLDWNNDEYSYIDHQSCGTVSDYCNNKEELKNFIFNPNSILTTDNDNH